MIEVKIINESKTATIDNKEISGPTEKKPSKGAKILEENTPFLGFASPTEVIS